MIPPRSSSPTQHDRTRLLALVPNALGSSPGQRFRMEQWAPYLQAAGVEVEFRPFESNHLRRVFYQPGHYLAKAAGIISGLNGRSVDARDARGYDAAYVFRESALLGPAVVERYLRWTRTPVVFDFDDAVFVPYVSPTSGWLSRLKMPAKTATSCQLASLVIAGNDYLATYAQRFNSRVEVVPTTIELSQYTPGSGGRSHPPVIGWSGSHSTVQHLDTVRIALQRLAATHEFELRVIGTASYELAGVATSAQTWNAANEVEDLRTFDIGIMPLPDDEWSKGKCGLKALQYMALGVPTVCSPVGVNCEIVADGENGLLASSDQEWVTALRRLLDSPDLRRRLGAAGRSTVEARYAAARHGPRIAALIKAMVRS